MWERPEEVADSLIICFSEHEGGTLDSCRGRRPAAGGPMPPQQLCNYSGPSLTCDSTAARPKVGGAGGVPAQHTGMLVRSSGNLRECVLAAVGCVCAIRKHRVLSVFPCRATESHASGVMPVPGFTAIGGPE